MTTIKRLFFLFPLLLLMQQNSLAQAIKGQLQTEEGEAANFALIALYNHADGLLLTGDFPDATGQFSFKDLELGTYQVLIDAGIGFEQIMFDSLVLDQAEQVIDLGKLTLAYKVQESVTATVKAEKIKPTIEYGLEKTTMNVEGTALGTFPSTLDVLKLAPEVSVNGGQISVLGKSNVLLLVNGKVSSLKFENIPANLIKSVDVISNPSAEYDATVDAVIIVWLKKGSLEGVQGSIYANYTQGVFPRANVGANISANKGQFSASLNVDYEYSKVYNRTWANRSFEVVDPFYYSSTQLFQTTIDHNFYTNGDLTWQPNDKHAITLSGEYSLFRAPDGLIEQNDAFSNTSEFDNLDSVLSSSNIRTAGGDNYQIQAAYIGTFAKDFTLKSAVNFMELKPRSSTAYAFEFDNNLMPSQNFDFNYQMKDTTVAQIFIAQVDGSWKKKGNRIDFGAKLTNFNTYYRIDFENNPPELTGVDAWFRYNERIFALYGQWKGSAGPLQWRFGLRGEYAFLDGVDDKEIHTTWNQWDYFPSAAFLFVPSETHIFKLTYNKSIQRVNFFDRSPYQYYTSLYTSFEGNPNLRPQVTHSVQLSYILSQAVMFTLYYNEKVDYINQVLSRSGSVETFQNINFQRSDIGLTISTQLPLTDWWKFSLKAEGIGLHTRGAVQGDPFDNWSVYTNIYCMQSFNLWNWMHLDAILSYSSPFSVGIYNTDHLFYVDLNLRKTFLNDQFTASIYVSDVFGTNLIRNSIDFGTQQMQALNNADVRTVRVALTYNFSLGREVESNPVNTLDDGTLERIGKNN